MLRNLIERPRVWAWLPVPLALLGSGFVGCGATGPTGRVEGRVTLNGAPAPEGTIVMFTEGPDPFSGTLGADGKFTVSKSVKVGAYAVAVQQLEKNDIDPAALKKASMEDKLPTFQSVIPEKYRSAATSGIKFEVKSGETNQFTLDIIPGAAKGVPAGAMPMKGGKG